AKHLALEKEVPVTAYLAGICLTESQVKNILDNYHAIGVQSVLCVRGDNPHDGAPAEDTGDFQHATELLTFVKSNFGFQLGAAGYPEGHVEAESKETDWDYLKLKVDKGAQYIISQYFYDNDYYYEFAENCRKRNINVPIVAGVMPIYSVKMMENLAAMCGATITQRVREGLAQINVEDKEAVGAFGIELALQQCRELLRNDVDGLHFYTMDRSQSVAKIVQQLRKEGVVP
ncbi:MAG: 5,10-methylenetetrahydrofolate reductase, partial [Candidatus Fischerbacteria bacterium RBG_13_37_8]